MKLNQLRISLSFLIALFVTGLALSACGGDDSSSTSIDGETDPQAVLDEAFGSESTIDSADVDLAVSIDAQGSDGGKVDLQLDGPFQSRAEEELPLLDLNLVAKATSASKGGQNFDFQGAATITDEGAFLTVDNQAYAVDPSTFSVFQDFYAQSVAAQEEAASSQGSALFDQLGIDPQTWLTDVSNAGVEDRDGTEVVHITGSADVAKILEDSQAIAQQTGQADQIDPADAQRLNDSVENAQIDVFVGTTDGLLRGFEGGLSFADDAKSSSDLSQADISFSLDFSSVNEDLEFTAPTDTKPLSELPGLDGLGGLGGLGAAPGGAQGAPPATGGAPPAGGGSSGGAAGTGAGGGGGSSGGAAGNGGGGASGGGAGTGGAGGGDSSQAYLDCLNQADSDKAIEDCAAKFR